MEKISLTKRDIDVLAHTLSPVAKMETIRKIGYYYNNQKDISASEKKIAEDIFRIMIKDFEVKVREVLVSTLKSSDLIPQDIINHIVSDVAAVASPFIRDYKNFNQEDLIKIINFNDEEKQKAVAKRKNLSENISHYIVEKTSAPVIETLLDNKTAQIEEKSFNIIVEKFINLSEIKEKIVEREVLPISIVERIISSLSVSLQKELIAKHYLPEDVVVDLVEQVRDKLTLRLSMDYDADEQMFDFVSALHKTGKLSSGLVVRAICLGDLKFFEFAICCLTNKSIIEVRKTLFFSQGDFEIRNLLRQAKIHQSLFVPVIIALKIIYELNFDLDEKSKRVFSKKVIERVLTYDNLNKNMEENDIKYLVSKIS